MIDGVAVYFYLDGRQWSFRRMWQAPEVGDEVLFEDHGSYKVIERVWDVTGLNIDERMERHPARCVIERVKPVKPVKRKKRGLK